MSSRWRWFAKDIRSAREGEGVTMLSRVLGADPGTWGTCSAFTGRGSAGDLRLRASDFRASDFVHQTSVYRLLSHRARSNCSNIPFSNILSNLLGLGTPFAAFAQVVRVELDRFVEASYFPGSRGRRAYMRGPLCLADAISWLYC